MKWLTSLVKKQHLSPLDEQKLFPSHVAIIMDGNGRWAKKRLLNRSAGHLAGTEAIREIVKAANQWNIKHLTLFAFSTENWKRPKEEVEYLFSLVSDFFKKYIQELDESMVKVSFIGDLTILPPTVLKVFNEAVERTKDHQHMVLHIAFNYGGQQDILQAVNKIILEKTKGPIDLKQFEERLWTQGMPPVDLLIRTSGEQRLSNFLLYLTAYSELYFTSTLWPDFRRQEFYQILQKFGQRHRRFGGL